MSERKWDIPTDYSRPGAAVHYRCDGCRAHGVKLWREYNTMASYTKLLCAACALKDQGKSGAVNEQGYLIDEDVGRCDQIGWLIPAVPTEEGNTFWGYTSVPDPGVRWWRALPTAL